MRRIVSLFPPAVRPMLVSALAAVCCLVLASSPGSGQEATTFGEEVDVRVVNIDVFVTDKKGARVRGLTRDDFLVYHDGRPVELSNFSRITERAADEEAATPEELATDTGSLPPRALAEPITTVIFVDNSTTTPHHRNRVLDEVEAFVVEQMNSGVQFMIAVFKPGLEILTPVTVDAEAARQVLREISEMPANGLRAISDRRQAMSMIQDIYDLYAGAGPGQAGGGTAIGAGGFGFDPCVDGWDQMIAAVDTYSQSAGARVGTVQAGLLGLARSLGGIPGRKALLYMSDGLEQRPGIDLYAYLGELCPRREREMFTYMTRWDETSLLEELTEYASAHRVTLYPLETTGLTNYSIASVEYASKRFTPSPRNDTLRVSNLQSSLFILAEQTGGQAFLNANSPAPDLKRMADDFREYYSLGIRPPAGWDGETHRIKVELVPPTAKGKRLRYRQRYRAIPEQERMAERTLATLVLGWEENPLGTAVRIGSQEAAEGKNWLVPVEIVLPETGLGTLPGESSGRQLIRVLMMAEDERGRRTPMREKVIPLNLAQESAGAGEPRTLTVNVELRAGPHSIAIGVRDEINQVTSFHRAAVVVGNTDSSL